MSDRQAQDVADVLGSVAGDAVSRLMRTMKSSRDLSNARLTGTIDGMADAVAGVLEEVRAHVSFDGSAIGEGMIANSVDRKDQIEAILPPSFTSGQRSMDSADVVFSRKEEDLRISMLFFRKDRLVAIDHVGPDDHGPRAETVRGFRTRAQTAFREVAEQSVRRALGGEAVPQADAGDATTLPILPFDPEKQSSRQDGDAEAFARVDALLPESGIARRMFDLVRPYRDPSFRYPPYRIVRHDVIDHFLSYCAAHGGTLKAMAAKVVDFRPSIEDSGSARSRARNIRKTKGLVSGIPVYRRASVAFERLGVPGVEARHATVDPSTLGEVRLPAADPCAAVVVETIDPELVDLLVSDHGVAIAPLTPIVIVFLAKDGAWTAEMLAGSSKVEFSLDIEPVDPSAGGVAARVASILSRSSEGRHGESSGASASHDLRDGADSPSSPPPRAMARVRMRVDDLAAAADAVDAWHVSILNRLGRDVLRSRSRRGDWYIEHVDGRDASRRWSVAVTCDPDDPLVITVELAGDGGPDAVPRIPAVVRRIAAACSAAGVDGRLRSGFMTIRTHADVDLLVRDLQDPTRVLPIVVVSDRGDLRLVEPDTLSAQTVGALDVRHIHDAAWDMLEVRIGPDMGVRSGEVRLYMPGFTPDGSPFDHPVVHLSNTGQRRLAQLVTREVGATLWRYDPAKRPSIRPADELPAPRAPDTSRVERPEISDRPALPRIPSYREIRRKVVPSAARHVAPERDMAPASAIPDEPLLPLADAGTDPQPGVGPHLAPSPAERPPEPETPDAQAAEHAISDRPEARPETDGEPSGTDRTPPETADPETDDEPAREPPDGRPEDDPVLPMDMPETRTEQDGGLRLKDVEVLFELYTEEMGRSQAVMNGRIDEAVSRMEAISDMVLRRLDPDFAGGVAGTPDRLREDAARERERDSEIEEMKDEMRRLRAALESERAASSARGVETRPLPRHMSEVREWFDATLSGRVHVVSKAWRSVRKCANDYPPHAVERMCRALQLLAGPGLDMHMGDERGKALWIEGLSEARLDMRYDSQTTCNAVARNERTVTYQGERLFMNRHLRGTESGHNDRDQLRIYYVHHEDTNQIVVGHLPTHLTTSDT